MTDYNNIKGELIELTRVKLDHLMTTWRSLFGPEEYNVTLELLRNFTNNYYDDLINESLLKRKEIEKSIAQLQKEADDLRRLLHTDLNLPTHFSESTPLTVVHQEIDKSLEKLREALRERRAHICELLMQQDELCDILGITQKPLHDDPLPTAEQLQDFTLHLRQLEELRVERLKNVANMRNDIKGYMKVLEMKVHTDTENRLLNDLHIRLTEQTLADLQRMRAALELKVQELCSSVDDMRKKLELLWQRLDTSASIRGKYRDLDTYDKRTYSLLLQELQRCEELKRQNLKQFVEQLRAELCEWWDKCMKSEKERQRFMHMRNNCYTDDLLVLHEMELEELKQFYEENKQIFDLYADRQTLWERMEALEAKCNDPARYNNRGGQLLREEKERKKIAYKLPKIEQQIKELVQKYEESGGKTFTINGDSILLLMEAQWERKRLEKELQMSLRKNKTPSSQGGRTPLSAKNATSATRSFLYSTRLTPSQQTLLRTPGVSAQKRTLQEGDKLLPTAKRNLRGALESPSVLKSAVNFKTPTMRKKIKPVIATAINRRSNGKAAAKRRSLRAKNQANVPRIQVEECSDVTIVTDDAYESFQKEIDQRSSTIIQCSNDEDLQYTKSTTNRLIPRIPTKF